MITRAPSALNSADVMAPRWRKGGVIRAPVAASQSWATSPLAVHDGVTQAVHAQGLAQSQLIGTVFDGIARHTPEGHAFARRAAANGFRAAVHERDDPFGDAGPSTFKG